VVHDFGAGTTGFAAADDQNERKTAVCLLPGTELAFANEIAVRSRLDFVQATGSYRTETKVARFVQIDKSILYAHHDALELPDGQIVRLTRLVGGQTATVLQLPAAPRTEKEVEEQERAAFVG
jgi:hypothetical protein